MTDPKAPAPREREPREEALQLLRELAESKLCRDEPDKCTLESGPSCGMHDYFISERHVDAAQVILAALTVAEQEIAKLKEAAIWRAGSASELSKLLNDIVQWTEADRSVHGPGPVGGYGGRMDIARRARELWLISEQEIATLRQQVAEERTRREQAEAQRDALKEKHD